ncbi:MAG: malK [Xanthobacteraceae bacterium]|jgi:multiple sugar transport system ATP-binding protein|nr:malK [Xanthobacteraceae bacterium]
MSAVALHHVTKRFGGFAAVADISLDVADGEFVVFVGPSGCGKSTLLRLIAGLEEAGEGSIAIGGRDVTALAPAERGIAMVFQSYALYPHMSVRENMAFGLQLARTAKVEAEARIAETAQRLGIADLLERVPKELSGGQRQRVAIGRALVRDPEVFLFDEPLSNLDAALRLQTRLELATLHADTGATMIYVTHDQVEAMTLADRIVVLNKGRIEQVGAPLELYRRPVNLFVARFIGSPAMNIVPVVAVERREGEFACTVKGDGTVLVPLGEGAGGAEPTHLGIRPEHVAIAPPDADAPGAMTGKALAVEHLGDAYLLHVALAEGIVLTVRGQGEAPVRRGDDVRLGIPGEASYLFAGDGEVIRWLGG